MIQTRAAGELTPISSSHWVGGTPWTGSQSITGQEAHRTNSHTCTHLYLRAIYSKQLDLESFFWTVGGSQSTRREPIHAQGDAKSMQKDRKLLLAGNSSTNYSTV
ncbi:hypothetical protein ILYODFUR_008173 [Ilyodon furcidens]|uniref:Uncharacterized protein n=1 Tax=Ilyodon furcidens TaxID=33524 RepID=A0ABV0SXR9_9TELE